MGSGSLTWAVVSVHGPFHGLSAFSPSRVACPYPDVVVGVVLEVRQGMGGRGGMGVAGFRRVGRVVLGALGPVDVVVGGRGVWSRWGFPREQELAGVVVGGREGFNGFLLPGWLILLPVLVQGWASPPALRLP